MLYKTRLPWGDTGSIPGSGRSPGGGHGNPPQYSCLESPVDRGAWRTTVHKVTKSRIGLKGLSIQARMLHKTWGAVRTRAQGSGNRDTE